MLTVDKYFKDKTFTVEDFHMIDVVKVECIFPNIDNQMYTLTLAEKSKENVIRSIHKLEIFEFTLRAEPNMIEKPA